MNGDQYGYAAYYAIWGLALAGSFYVTFRGNWGQAAQQAAIWALIFLGGIGIAGAWPQIKQAVMPTQSVSASGAIVIPRGPDSHYHLRLGVNGEPIDFLIDTGATEMVLTKADAQTAGINLSGLNYLGRASTANGIVRTARVRLGDVALGDIVDFDFPASVNDGELDKSLLGMSYLNLFDSIEIRNNEMILTR